MMQGFRSVATEGQLRSGGDVLGQFDHDGFQGGSSGKIGRRIRRKGSRVRLLVQGPGVATV
jgi:hypothetical protein